MARYSFPVSERIVYPEGKAVGNSGVSMTSFFPPGISEEEPGTCIVLVRVIGALTESATGLVEAAAMSKVAILKGTGKDKLDWT